MKKTETENFSDKTFKTEKKTSEQNKKWLSPGKRNGNDKVELEKYYSKMPVCYAISLASLFSSDAWQIVAIKIDQKCYSITMVKAKCARFRVCVLLVSSLSPSSSMYWNLSHIFACTSRCVCMGDVYAPKWMEATCWNWFACQKIVSSLAHVFTIHKNLLNLRTN